MRVHFVFNSCRIFGYRKQALSSCSFSVSCIVTWCRIRPSTILYTSPEVHYCRWQTFLTQSEENFVTKSYDVLSRSLVFANFTLELMLATIPDLSEFTIMFASFSFLELRKSLSTLFILTKCILYKEKNIINRNHKSKCLHILSWKILYHSNFTSFSPSHSFSVLWLFPNFGVFKWTFLWMLKPLG